MNRLRDWKEAAHATRQRIEITGHNTPTTHEIHQLVPNLIPAALALLLIVICTCSFTSCSAEHTADRQGGITDVHQGMIDRRESRQEARDARFDASRDSWMN